MCFCDKTELSLSLSLIVVSMAHAESIVTFARDAKAHDGLLPAKRVFDTLWLGVAKHAARTAAYVAAECHDTSTVRELLELITDLSARIMEAEVTVPVLIDGGGFGFKAGRAHLGLLEGMRVVVTEALALVVELPVVVLPVVVLPEERDADMIDAAVSLAGLSSLGSLGSTSDPPVFAANLPARRRRRTVATQKVYQGSRCVRLCSDCTPPKYVNYKNYSHHVRDMHSA